MRSLRADTRGDSEVVGFAFIFAMAILSILVVLVSGQAGLTDARDAGRVTNAVHALDVLADNVDDLAYHGAPSRSTEIELDGATLGYGEPVTVEVNVDGDAHTYQLRPIVYEADTGTELVYVDGAVIREDRGGTVMLREPDLLLTGDETAVTVVRLTPVEDARAVGGATTVDVRTTRTRTDLVVAETGGGHVVTYSVTSPHADAWKRHLDEAVGGCDLPDGSDTVTCTVSNVDRVYVTVVDVDVRFD